MSSRYWFVLLSFVALLLGGGLLISKKNELTAPLQASSPSKHLPVLPTSAPELPRQIFIPGFASEGGRWLLLDKKNKPLRETDITAMQAYAQYGQRVFASPARSENGLWGYLDVQGQWVLPPQFQEARVFSEEGLARVKLNGRWGYIDQSMQLRIQPQFEDAQGFHHGLAAVQIKKHWGYIDSRGSVVIPAEFAFAASFSQRGLARIVQFDQKTGFINRSGKIVIAARFDQAHDFDEMDVAPVQEGRLWGVIDYHGQWVLQPSYENIGIFNHNKLAAFRHADNGTGYLNEQGKVIIPASHTLSDVMEQGLVRADDSSFYFLNNHGKKVIEGPFDWVADFTKEGGPVAARKQGRWGLLSPQGGWLDVGDHREPFSSNGSHQPDTPMQGLTQWLYANQAIEWRDSHGALVYRLEQRKLSSGKTVLQFRQGHEVIWQSRPQLHTLHLEPFFEPTAQDLLSIKEDAVVQEARRLLASRIRRFYPASRVFGGSADPYDLKGLSASELDESRWGSMQTLASSYVDENESGHFDFLALQRAQLFDPLQKRLCKRLSAEFGNPQQQLPENIALTLGDSREICAWHTGGKWLVLLYFVQTGDGDFEHRIDLMAISSPPSVHPLIHAPLKH